MAIRRTGCELFSQARSRYLRWLFFSSKRYPKSLNSKLRIIFVVNFYVKCYVSELEILRENHATLPRTSVRMSHLERC